MAKTIVLDDFQNGRPLFITLSAEDARKADNGEKIDLQKYIDAAKKGHADAGK